MRLCLTALVAALCVGCSTTPPTPTKPPPPPPLSPEAAAFFARAEAPGPGAAMVVDLDALEDLGLLAKGPTLHQLATVGTFAMSQLSTGEGSEARRFARGAVVSALLREWAKWPNLRRIGFLVPSPRAMEAGPEALPEYAVGALAVDEGSPDNAQLLAGLVAILRSVAEELSREEGTDVRVSLLGQDLCVEEGPDPKMPLCIRPRRGLMLFGSPAALTGFEALPPVTAPAAAPGEAPLLMGFRLDLGPKGHGQLAFTGRDAVRLAFSLEGASAKDLGTLESLAKRVLTEYDAHQAQVRDSIAAGLAELQRAIAQDPNAPASLKQQASALTADRVVDEKGYWAQARQSVQMSSTQERFALSFTVPSGAVKDFSEFLSTWGTPVALMGVMAAVAIPNFHRFEARSKQAEAVSNLKLAYTVQRVYFQEKNRWGRSFEEIGFVPDKGRRYTYCMGKQCLPCDGPGCKVAPPPSPCQGLTSVGQTARDGFSICAYANLDSDDAWDVWVIDQSGEPQNLSNDMEAHE